MPVVGWLFGNTIEPYVKNIDHWVAFGSVGLRGDSHDPLRVEQG